VDHPATRSIVLFDRDLQTADTVGPLPATRSVDRIADLLAGSDGTTLYLALRFTDGTAVARVGRLTGSTLALERLPEDSISGMWLLPDAQTLVVATIDDQQPGIRQGLLRLLPVDLANAGLAVPACAGAVTGFTSLGRRGRAYVGCDTETIVEIDVTLGLVVRTAGVSGTNTANRSPCGTTDVASSPNGTILYVLCREAGTLLYLDRLTLTALAELEVGVGASAVALTPDGGRAIVTRAPSGEVVVVDLRRREVRARIAIPTLRRVVIGSGRYGYAVSTGGGSQPGRLARIDIENGLLVAERELPGGASLLSLWPQTETPYMRWTSPPALQAPEP
jgi:DNA-binding beta-propeller fold protein YncE